MVGSSCNPRFTDSASAVASRGAGAKPPRGGRGRSDAAVNSSREGPCRFSLPPDRPFAVGSPRAGASRRRLRLPGGSASHAFFGCQRPWAVRRGPALIAHAGCSAAGVPLGWWAVNFWALQLLTSRLRSKNELFPRVFSFCGMVTLPYPLDYRRVRCLAGCWAESARRRRRSASCSVNQYDENGESRESL